MRCTLRWFRFTRPGALLLATLLGACERVATTPAPVVSTASLDRLADRLGPTWSVVPGRSSVFGCFTSSAVADTGSAYRYRFLPLSIPSARHHARGEVTSLQVRGIDRAGRLGGVANCIIPRTQAAADHVLEVLRVPADAQRYGSLPGSGGAGKDGLLSFSESVAGCVVDGLCELEGLVVIGNPKPREPYSYEPECSVGAWCFDPGYPVDQQPGGGGATGSSPCATCGPSQPILACTPATIIRGGEVSCAVSPAVATSFWRWTDGSFNVSGPSGAATWAGTAVKGGTVTVGFPDGSEQVAAFAVSLRNWTWGPDRWTFVERGGPVNCAMRPPAVGALVTYGWNMNRNASCVDQSGRFRPDLLANRHAGYTAAEVTGGPNDGWWYVTSASYTMDRGSNINPSLLPTAPKAALPEGPQAQMCRARMGLPPTETVRVNFYTMNEVCAGLDVDAFIRAILDHEGFGSNGANGHESLSRSYASWLRYDPYVVADREVHATEYELREAVGDSVYARNIAVAELGNDHTLVRGNYPHGSPTFYIIDPATGLYHLLSFGLEP